MFLSPIVVFRARTSVNEKRRHRKVERLTQPEKIKKRKILFRFSSFLSSGRVTFPFPYCLLSPHLRSRARRKGKVYERTMRQKVPGIALAWAPYLSSPLVSLRSYPRARRRNEARTRTKWAEGRSVVPFFWLPSRSYLSFLARAKVTTEGRRSPQ